MSDLISRAELFNRLATVQDMAAAYAVIQDMQTVEPMEAYYKGKIDGINECMNDLRKILGGRTDG
jgi:hypothetical protein